MKKIAILIIAIFLFTTACADTFEYEFSYNYWAKKYNLQEIGSDHITKNTEDGIVYEYGDTNILFMSVSSSSIDSAGVIAPDSTDFLPTCVAVAMAISDDYEGIVNFYGFLLNSYLEIKSGKNSSIGFYNNMVFYLKPYDDNRLIFTIGTP